MWKCPAALSGALKNKGCFVTTKSVSFLRKSFSTFGILLFLFQCTFAPGKKMMFLIYAIDSNYLAVIFLSNTSREQLPDIQVIK